MTLEARVPPHRLEAEIAVLGSILLDNEMMSEPAVGQLVPEDFYREGHRLIWRAFQALRAERNEQGQPSSIDLVTVLGQLTRQGQLDNAGGMVYLAGLGDQVPTAARADHYARIVLEMSNLRRKIRHAGEVMRACYDQQMPLEDIDQLASESPQLKFGGDDVVRLGGVVGKVLAQAAEGNRPRGYTTGLKDLDAQIRGLEPGRLYVVAARPGFGKTALAAQMGLAVSQTAGRVLMFSLEMPAEEIATRLVCSEARVDLVRLSQSSEGDKTALNERDWQRLTRAQERLDNAPFDILTKNGLLLQSLIDQVRREHQREPLKLFVLDYLQLVQVSGRAGENATQRVTMITTALKGLAMELGIPVMALSQLSREVEKRPNHRPMLSDLRESGSVEQDADVVMFIYRDEKYHPDTDQPGIAEIIVGKQRNGPTGTVRTTFLAAFVRFVDLAED